jgi:hypothetical protein
MFLVLIQYEDDGEAIWAVVDGPFKTERAARVSARLMAGEHHNTYAIVESKGFIRRTIIKVKVLEES